MTYKISIEKKALKFIMSQPKNQQARIFKAIHKLPAGSIKAVQGYDNLFRLRVGDYRFIFTITPETETLSLINVTDAGNRGQIYNNY